MAFVSNNSQQLSLMDSTFNLTERERKFLEKSWAKAFADKIFPAINEELFSVLYSSKASRPNTPVNVIVGALILKEALGDSDDELVEALMFDIRYQYALHTTSFEEQPLSDRTLSRFRARCLAYETETGIDLIPANKRLADAADRLQVTQLSQYNTAGEAETLCEEVMDKLLDALREQYDYCGRSPTHRAYMISLTYRALRRRILDLWK